MKELYAQLDRLLKNKQCIERWKKLTGGTPSECQPIFSFDNAGCHSDSQTLFRLHLINGWSWDKLPPHSGDLHRVVERVHARLCGRFADWLYDDSTPLTMPEYCYKLETLFYETELADIHAADIRTIDALYKRVVQLKGARPEACYR